jgi:hypothetical protein
MMNPTIPTTILMPTTNAFEMKLMTLLQEFTMKKNKNNPTMQTTMQTTTITVTITTTIQTKTKMMQTSKMKMNKTKMNKTINPIMNKTINPSTYDSKMNKSPSPPMTRRKKQLQKSYNKWMTNMGQEINNTTYGQESLGTTDTCTLR